MSKSDSTKNWDATCFKKLNIMQNIFMVESAFMIRIFKLSKRGNQVFSRLEEFTHF